MSQVIKSLSTGSNYFHIQNASGTDLGTFMPPRGAYYYHFSSPESTTSTTYTVYIGGSYSNTVNIFLRRLLYRLEHIIRMQQKDILGLMWEPKNNNDK